MSEKLPKQQQQDNQEVNILIKQLGASGLKADSVQPIKEPSQTEKLPSRAVDVAIKQMKVGGFENFQARVKEMNEEKLAKSLRYYNSFPNQEFVAVYKDEIVKEIKMRGLDYLLQDESPAETAKKKDEAAIKGAREKINRVV